MIKQSRDAEPAAASCVRDVAGNRNESPRSCRPVCETRATVHDVFAREKERVSLLRAAALYTGLQER